MIDEKALGPMFGMCFKMAHDEMLEHAKIYDNSSGIADGDYDNDILNRAKELFALSVKMHEELRSELKNVKWQTKPVRRAE